MSIGILASPDFCSLVSVDRFFHCDIRDCRAERRARVVFIERTCHAGRRRFESRRARQIFRETLPSEVRMVDGGTIVRFRVARHLPVAEDIRSCARENLSRSLVLCLVLWDLAADERFQLPLSLLKRSQRKPVLCP